MAYFSDGGKYNMDGKGFSQSHVNTTTTINFVVLYATQDVFFQSEIIT